MKRTLVESVVFEPGDTLEVVGASNRYCILWRHGSVAPVYTAICCASGHKREIRDMPVEVFESAKYVGHVDKVEELVEWIKEQTRE